MLILNSLFQPGTVPSISIPSLGDVLIIVNMLIAIIVAFSEYRRRKAQNKADEGGAVSSIASAAATLSESTVALLVTKDLEIKRLSSLVDFKNTQIECYQTLLKENSIKDTVCDE